MLKTCKGCKQLMPLKKRRDKTLESPRAYAARNHCNSRCYGLTLVGRGWGRGYKASSTEGGAESGSPLKTGSKVSVVTAQS